MVTISPETPAGGTSPSQESPSQESREKCLEECYTLALRSVAEYAVELDAPATREFQHNVFHLEERAASGPPPEVLRSLQASFRGELREYHDRGRVYIKRLRDELEGTTEVMQTFASSLISNGEDVQKRVRGEMTKLEKAAEDGNLDEIRASVQATIREVLRSYEELNKANALVTAELQHEIRLLHQNIQEERRVAWTDAASGAWVKNKLDQRLTELLKTAQPFYLIVILVSNLKRLKTQGNAALVDRALGAMVKRFYGILGQESLIARLSPDHFAAVVEVDSATAQIMARQVGERLSSRYSVQNNGNAYGIDLSINCGIVPRPSNSDPAEFCRKMQQMTGLAGAAEIAEAAALGLTP